LPLNPSWAILIRLKTPFSDLERKMSFFGEVFSSEIIRKPVLDPKGEEIGKVKDLVIIRGETLPIVSALILERKKQLFHLPWGHLNIFKKIISSRIYGDNLHA
jgi:magnesium transporter